MKRTMYEAARHTPKRNVVRSSRARGAKKEGTSRWARPFFIDPWYRQNTTPWSSTVTRGLLMILNLYHVSTSFFLQICACWEKPSLVGIVLADTVASKHFFAPAILWRYFAAGAWTLLSHTCELVWNMISSGIPLKFGFALLRWYGSTNSLAFPSLRFHTSLVFFRQPNERLMVWSSGVHPGVLSENIGQRGEAAEFLLRSRFWKPRFCYNPSERFVR